MAELKDLLAGCMATDPAGIEAYINQQMKTQNIKMFLDDGVKDIFVPKSRLDAVLGQLRTANETITQQAADIAQVGKLTKDNADAQETITKLQNQLTSSQQAMQKMSVTTAVSAVAEKLGFILPAEDLVGFIDAEKLKVNADGTVTGVEEALKNLKQTKPYLAKATDGSSDGGSQGGNSGVDGSSGNAGGGTGDPGKPNNGSVFGGKGYKAGQFGKMMGEQVAKSNPAGAKDPFFG